MFPLLLVLGVCALSTCEPESDVTLFAVDVDALRSGNQNGASQLIQIEEFPQPQPRLKRQSEVSYQVNHYEVQDQVPHEARPASAVAVAPNPSGRNGAGRGARQLGPARYGQPTQQRVPDYADYVQQYGSALENQQPQYFGLAQYGPAEQEPAQPTTPPPTLSPEVQEQVRLQQEYKDRPILEQERLALGLRRPPAPAPANPAGASQRGFGLTNPAVQFVSAGGQPLVSPSYPRYVQDDQSQQQYPSGYDQGEASSGSEEQYFPARPLFTSAEAAAKSSSAKRLVPKEFPSGKSLIDPALQQSFSYTQLQFGDASPSDKYLYHTKLNDLRSKLVPQPEPQHVAQRSTLKQRPKYEPSYVYDAAAYQIESSTPNSLPHYVASTPKTQYVSQAQPQYYQVVPTGTPGLVYTQSSGASGLVSRPINAAKGESSTGRPQHQQIIQTIQPHYIAATPDYQQYYESNTPNPSSAYANYGGAEPSQKHHVVHKPKKLIAPDFVTAAGEQQLRQLQRLQNQQLQHAQHAQHQQGYDNQGIEFDQDLYASVYSQPSKGYYANIKKSVAQNSPSANAASYANAPSKSAYFVTTAAPLSIRESTLSGQDDYSVYKNNELNDLSVQTPDGRKPLTPAEVKALVNAGFNIPELKQQQESATTVHVRQKPVYSYQPVAVPQSVRSSTTEIPGYVTRAQSASPTYDGQIISTVSTVSPYDLQDVSDGSVSPSRSTEQRYRTTPQFTLRKRIPTSPTPTPLTAEEGKLVSLPRDSVRHYYSVDASGSGAAPQTYVLVGGSHLVKASESSKGLSQYSSRLVARSTPEAGESKKPEKMR